ncbi:hypothetical protein Bpfe_016516, partial [Biomphalaria pfeifferi]
QRLTYICLELLAILVSTLAAPLVTTSFSLDNPCGLAPGAALELPPNVVDLLKATITDANAASAANQAVVNKLRSDVMLTENEIITYTNKTLPGLPLRLPEVNVSKINELARKIRLNQMNLHLLYSANDILLNANVFPTDYLQSLSDINSKVLGASCRISKILLSLDDTFSQNELNVDKELQIVDFTAYGTAEIELHDLMTNGADSLDLKSASVAEFLIANEMMGEMRSLVHILDAEARSHGESH